MPYFGIKLNWIEIYFILYFKSHWQCSFWCNSVGHQRAVLYRQVRDSVNCRNISRFLHRIRIHSCIVIYCFCVGVYCMLYLLLEVWLVPRKLMQFRIFYNVFFLLSAPSSLSRVTPTKSSCSISRKCSTVFPFWWSVTIHRRARIQFHHFASITDLRYCYRRVPVLFCFSFLSVLRFTGSVKLKGIIISGEDDDSHPAEIRLCVSMWITCSQTF